MGRWLSNLRCKLPALGVWLSSFSKLWRLAGTIPCIRIYVQAYVCTRANCDVVDGCAVCMWCHGFATWLARGWQMAARVLWSWEKRDRAESGKWGVPLRARRAEVARHRISAAGAAACVDVAATGQLLVHWSLGAGALWRGFVIGYLKLARPGLTACRRKPWSLSADCCTAGVSWRRLVPSGAKWARAESTRSELLVPD